MTAADGRVTVRASNDGAVVPAEALPRLAEPFTRLERSTRRRGSGLGLSIVRAVAEAHGGALRLAPREAGGLDVEVTLPASVATATAAGVSAGGACVDGAAVAVAVGVGAGVAVASGVADGVAVGAAPGSARCPPAPAVGVAAGSPRLARRTGSSCGRSPATEPPKIVSSEAVTTAAAIRNASPPVTSPSRTMRPLRRRRRCGSSAGTGGTATRSSSKSYGSTNSWSGTVTRSRIAVPDGV